MMAKIIEVLKADLKEAEALKAEVEKAIAFAKEAGADVSELQARYLAALRDLERIKRAIEKFEGKV